MDTVSSGTLQDSSSRTGSSDKSTKAEVKEVKEIDFTKDSKTSPIDLECGIQEERVTKIIDEAIHKTKLALALPTLVQEYNTLKTILSSDHYDDLLFIFDQYDNPLFSSSLLNLGAVEDIRAGDESLSNRLNPELGHLIYILASYPDLKPKTDEIINEIKADSVRSSIAAPGLKHLLVLEQFRDLLVVRMSTTAEDDLAKKIWTKKYTEINNILKAEIKELSVKIQSEYEEFIKNMAEKQDIIKRLTEELAVCEKATEARLKKKVLDSERQQVLKSRAHDIKYEIIKEEEIETRDSYQNLLNHHLADEKAQRARRFKVETQLISWLQKYDTEMSDKQIELDDYTKKLEDETEKVHELKIEIAEQDLEYLPLMAERDAEYAAEMTEKMKAFGLDHAARVIQLAWRDVLTNRAEKRKLKKILQKRKEDMEGKTIKKKKQKWEQ